MSFYKDEQLIQLLSKIRLPAYATAPKIQRQKPSPSTTITSTLSRSPSSGGRSKILERMFGFFRREDKIIEERRENSDKNVSDSSNSNMPQQQPNTISGNDISSPFAEEERQINELVSSLLADITEQLRVLKTQSNEHRQLYERQVDKGKRTKNMVDLEMALEEKRQVRLLQATQIIARLDRIFSRFQLQLDLLEPLLEGYIEAIDLQWLDCGKATSAQWRFLPTISLAVASVPKSSAHTPAASELSSADQMFPLNFSPRLVYRHSVDSRFDFKQVSVNGIEVPYGERHPLSAYNQIESSPAQDRFSAKLFATFPWVNVPSTADLPSTSNPYVQGNKVLLNDPNNDGYLTIVCDGFVVGATVDGSGSGAHARLSANLILSTLYENLSELNDRIHGKKRGSVVRGSDDSAIPSKTPRASSAGERRRSFSNAAATKPPALIVNTGPANSSDIYEWLQKVVVLAHQKCKSVTEAGSSSASFFVILKRAEYSSTFLTSPQDPNNNNQQPTADNFHSNSTIYNPDLDYVCFFAAVGDVEAYHYSKYTGKWSNILKEISPFDRVRIDSTRSPGGIGGHYGDHKKIFGMYLWADEEWGLSPAVASTASVSSTIDVYQPRRKASKNDLLLFSTDGLGDAVDPAQIFASPNSAGVLAELVGFPILPPKTSTNAVTAESSAAEGGREGGGVGSAYPNLHDTTLATLPDLPDEDTLSLAMGAGSLSLADDKTIGESWISFARKVPLAAVKIGALKDIILNIVISNNEDTQYEECSDDEEEKEKRWEGGKGDTTSTSADKQKLESKEEILDALVEQDFGDGPSEIKSPPRDSSVVLSSLKPSYSFRNRPGSKVYNTEVVYGPNDKKQRIKLQQDALSPQNVVDKCTEFALKITSGERDLYSQPEFMQQSSWIKRELSDMSKTQWIKSHPTPDSCDWASGDRERFRKPKFLNPFIIPFAKMDHISVQCISPSILLTDSKN